ncbi:hypothetical protein BX265_2838 [Streptomyces sp. TLI_235]|nr:hypothetical protein [Streptomyces sp. TLI_235]PBC78079.1 hypothetical protein BX265_2838 [Streptomyces sp. TLI_235]
MSEAPLPSAADLVDAVDRLADRFRSMPQSRLLAAVPGHPSRARAGLALARSLASAALELEGEPPHEVPDAGPFAVGDQLSVAGHDLVLAAQGRPEAVAAALAAVRETERLTA